MLRKICVCIMAIGILNASEIEDLDIEVGAVGLIYSGLYRDVSTQVEGYPLLIIHYKDFYFDGLLAKYYLYRDEHINIAIEMMPTLYNYESSMSKYLDGMEDREVSFESGLSADYTFGKNKIGTKILRDWQNIHNGWSVTTQYSRNLFMSQESVVMGYVTLEYMDKKKSDYYYGVKQSEATSWRKAYSVDGAETFALGFKHMYKFSQNITFIGNIEYKYFSSSITNSPIVEDNYQTSAYAAILYKIY